MSQESNKQPAVQVTTRLEPELAEQLIEIARQERRSVGAQLIVALEFFLENRTAKSEG